jgi:MFS family permease
MSNSAKSDDTSEFAHGEETVDTQAISKAGLLAPLKLPTFRSFWIASWFATVGGMSQMVAAGWLMSSLTSSAVFVGLVTSAVTLPVLFLAPIGGAVADGANRRTLMMFLKMAMALVAFTMAAVAWAGMMTPWMLLGFLFVSGVAGSFSLNCQQVYFHDMVPRVLMPPAVALHSMQFNLARSFGPAVGGFLVGSLGAASAFFLNAFSSLGLLAVLARHPVLPESPVSSVPFLIKMHQGWRYLMLRPRLRVLLFRSFLVGAANTSMVSLLPLLARDSFGFGPKGFGFLVSSFGFGCMAGAMISHLLLSRLGMRATIHIQLAVFLAAAATLAASSLVWLSSLALIVGGIAITSTNLCHNLAVRLSVPPDLVGRIMAYFNCCHQGGFAIGALAAGILVRPGNLAPAFWMACILAGLSLVLSLFNSLPRAWREVPETQSGIGKSTQ